MHAPEHDLSVTAEFKSEKLYVHVRANKYLHELSLLSEIVGLGTQVDSQMVYLLAGEEHTFIVSGEHSILEKVEAQLKDLLWSHNRVVNS
jgi:hypothetical protein